jgi:hypothetical protein
MKTPYVILCILFATTAIAQDCPSQATLNITSSGYSGAFNVELRSGTRPGSRAVQSRAVEGNGSTVFGSVCRGTYFFSFGTPDSDQVSVTRYFEVTNNGESYSNPKITVFYSRGISDGARRVGSSKKRDL